MQQKATSKLFLVLLFFTVGLHAQGTDGDKSQVHSIIKNFDRIAPEGKDSEAAKKLLEGFDTTELANLLIAEFDLDRGNPDLNNSRDVAVITFYKELKLPVSILLTKLANTQSPYKKYQLMRCLPKTNDPAVIKALEAQLNDQRVAASIKQKYIEMAGPTYAFRVCDIACAILNKDLERKSEEILWVTPIDRRDQIIKQTVEDLKLGNR